MLNFEGKVTSGLGKAGMFMQKDTYQKQYMDKLGFVPYNGTLNVKLNNDIEINLKEKYDKKLKIIKGNKTLGDVYFLHAKISNIDKTLTQEGAILFPTKTVHKIDTIEFVAQEKLRDAMKLEDNIKVIVSIDEK